MLVENNELKKYEEKIIAEELSMVGGVNLEELSDEARKALLDEYREKEKKEIEENEKKENRRRKSLKFPPGYIPQEICEKLRDAGNKMPTIIRNWQEPTFANSKKSGMSSEQFCERMTEQLLISLFNEVGGEVEQLFDDFVEGLVEHELQ